MKAVQAPPAKEGKGNALQKPMIVFTHHYTGVSEINPDLLELLADAPTSLGFVSIHVCWL